MIRYVKSRDKSCVTYLRCIMNDEHASDDDYKHAKTVWDIFNLKSMGYYHDLYRKSDILLLADVFENFRKTSMKYYQSDTCHYVIIKSVFGLGY